jgi:hypothetical protein
MVIRKSLQGFRVYGLGFMGHHLHGPAQIAVKLAHGHISLVHAHDWRIDSVDAVDLIIDNGITAASTPRGEGRRVLLRRFDDAPIKAVDSLFRVWGLGFGIWDLGFGIWDLGLRV